MARIVIVDDDDLVSEIVGDALAGCGHMVSTVEDGLDATGAILRSEPDLVILDYSLPGATGMQILRDIRMSPSCTDMPVMMLTARSGALHIGRAMHEGADDYVVKPFDVDELVGRVEALLAASRRLRGVATAA